MPDALQPRRKMLSLTKMGNGAPCVSGLPAQPSLCIAFYPAQLVPIHVSQDNLPITLA